MSKRFCLVCDGEPVVEIGSVTGDVVRLCRLHWAAYAKEQGGFVGQMVDKFFGDCGETWQERAGRCMSWLDSPGRRTDEERGRYEAGQADE